MVKSICCYCVKVNFSQNFTNSEMQLLTCVFTKFLKVLKVDLTVFISVSVYLILPSPGVNVETIKIPFTIK